MWPAGAERVGYFKQLANLQRLHPMAISFDMELWYSASSLHEISWMWRQTPERYTLGID